MKTLLTITAFIFLLCGSLKGQEAAIQTAYTDSVQVQLSANHILGLNMNLVLPEELKISSNRMMIFTPVLKTEGKEVLLHPVYVYGRKRQIISNRKKRYPVEGSQVLRRTNRKEQVIRYEESLPYETWMQGADLILEQDLCGCGNHREENYQNYLAQVPMPEPELPGIMYCTPKPEKIKKRTYKGRAFLDFPLDQTIIYPEYRRNAIELARIDTTLQKFKIDHILSITIHGYASPEGKYTHNYFLAKERTKALKEYILNKYALADSIIGTEYTAEDWEGFIQFAEQSNLKDKQRILEIARSDVHPDTKEKQLKAMPNSYWHISKNWLPALRHSDYEVEYVLPNYSSDEARGVVQKDPLQLSLREMYDAAQLCKKGSPEFYQIMETAVKTYPDNPEANLNAAAMELERGNVEAAKSYMEKADMNTPEAKNNMKRIKMLEEVKL